MHTHIHILQTQISTYEHINTDGVTGRPKHITYKRERNIVNNALSTILFCIIYVFKLQHILALKKDIAINLQNIALCKLFKELNFSQLQKHLN